MAGTRMYIQTAFSRSGFKLTLLAGAFVFVATLISYAFSLNYARSISQEVLFKADQPAKYIGGSFYSQDAKQIADLRFVTTDGEKVLVTGKIADDMVSKDVVLAGSGFVRLTYETTIRYSKYHQEISRENVVKSWKPLRSDEPFIW